MADFTPDFSSDFASFNPDSKWQQGLSVAIINMALDLLKEEPILSATDDRVAVRWMARNFGPVRDSLLRQHPWNFAMARAVLPALSQAPAFGWAYQYALPSDCVRVLPMTGATGLSPVSGTLNGASIKYSIEGRKLLTNAAPPINLSYITRVTDERVMDATFVQVFAMMLAIRSANFITGKASYAQALKQDLAQLMLQAQMIDALESSPPDPEQDDWVNGRSGQQYWNAQPGTIY